MRISRNSFWMFLIGLGSATKVYVVGLLSFSEMFVFLVAPFIYLRHKEEFSKVGFNTFFGLVFLMIIGGLVSTIYNGRWFFAYLKHAAVLYSIFAFAVVFYWLLRKDFRGLNWLALGCFISSIIIIWFFNPTLHMDESVGTIAMEGASSEEVMSEVRFWNTRIGGLLKIPINGEMYMNIPIWYSMLALAASAIVSMTMSISGRSDAAVAIMAMFLIAIARKSRKRMNSIGRHFILFLVIVFAIAIVGKNAYKYCASRGILGEAARNKYISQTKRGDSLLQILMAGRIEFFVGIRALMDQPIMGFGVDADDSKGYRQEYLAKYGDIMDYMNFLSAVERNERNGYTLKISTHSFIVEFWGRSGISGLAFCVYLFYLFYIFFKRYAGAIPQWYGLFACAIPAFLWGMFFSPYGHGPTRPLLITCILIARAVGQGKMRLPIDMEMEIRRNDR